MRLNKKIRLQIYKKSLDIIRSFVYDHDDYLFGLCYTFSISKVKLDLNISSDITKYPELMLLKKKYNIKTNRKTRYWDIDTSTRIKLLEECISMLETPQTLKK